MHLLKNSFDSFDTRKEIALWLFFNLLIFTSNPIKPLTNFSRMSFGRVLYIYQIRMNVFKFDGAIDIIGGRTSYLKIFFLSFMYFFLVNNSTTSSILLQSLLQLPLMDLSTKSTKSISSIASSIIYKKSSIFLILNKSFFEDES